MRLRSGRSSTPARDTEGAPNLFPLAVRGGGAPRRALRGRRSCHYTKTIKKPAKPCGSTGLRFSAVKCAPGMAHRGEPAASRTSSFGPFLWSQRRALLAKRRAALERTGSEPRKRAGPRGLRTRKRKEDALSSVLVESSSDRSDPRRTGSIGQSVDYLASCERAFWTENGQAW